MKILKKSLLNFINRESAIGVLLILATLFAMLVANSTWSSLYVQFLNLPVVVTIHELEINKPLLLWVNDGLMAIFFFMVGLELKREVLEGHLKERSKIILPIFGALGGMFVPAIIYTLFNWNEPYAWRGWAIPMATDIAFALGVLSLLGKRVPSSLKVFLMTLAVIDDLGAIAVIALFFGGDLSAVAIGISSVLILVMWIMNRSGVTNNAAYILLGIVVWVAVLKSGVHATIAGVIVALFIPLKNNKSSFYALESSLYAPVNYVILPLFAFVNTGVNFSGLSSKDFFDSVTLGIASGLFFGKQIGIFTFSLLAVVLKLGKLPEGVHFGHLYGLSLLGGIGFTMSLFMGSLAFECSGGLCFDITDERIGILLGSLLSGISGYFVLKWQFRK